ncbi:putative membrane protein [Kitasatospora gansuensis]|uniref:Putative membrane protein n=1 Tax=Kitasatospora gansuensis TaxID=258050 RepID=A0A7W7WLF5_9ACTN|nr:hypothetical protein [Kitasatospora gansuensis]MBB4951747.1 putative membrane protein [Kitasatospora gansuensis]
MKKRSLLAAASLATGVALSLTAPHAAHAHATAETTEPVGATTVDSVTGVLPIGDADTLSGTGTAASLLPASRIAPSAV